jgi:hypothetical protein
VSFQLNDIFVGVMVKLNSSGFLEPSKLKILVMRFDSRLFLTVNLQIRFTLHLQFNSETPSELRRKLSGRKILDLRQQS